MDEKFNSILSITIIPQTVSLIAEKEQIDEMKALDDFYQSKVYAMLTQEETKMWHYSPLTVYNMWKHEQETGEVLFPEE